MEISEMVRNNEVLFRFIGMGLSTVYFGSVALFVSRQRAKGAEEKIPQLLAVIGVVMMVSYFWWLNTLQ